METGFRVNASGAAVSSCDLSNGSSESRIVSSLSQGEIDDRSMHVERPTLDGGRQRPAGR
jgi:hypothetical protein